MHGFKHKLDGKQVVGLPRWV